MPVREWVPKHIRAAAQKRTCQRCGGSGSLDLHHIDGNRKNNSLANLLTLCDSCHTKTHWETDKRATLQPRPLCAVCDRPARHSGLCETHRSRLLRHGSPLLKKKKIGREWVLMEETG